MLELILELDCVPFADTDPLKLTLHDEVLSLSTLEPREILISQYSSLIGEYTSELILAEKPESVESIMADDISGSHLIDSKSIKAMSYSDSKIKRLTLKYNEIKAPLVKRIQRVYDIFARLGAERYAPAKIPPNARISDIFTSHHSQLFVFETPENEKYIRLRKDADKVKWKDADPVVFFLRQ